MRTSDYVAKLISLANENIPSNSIESRIAQVMLSHLNELGNLQNQELANLCFVDAATISRFVRSLGFLKYGEFKTYFKEYNEVHNINYYFDLDHLPTNNVIFEDTIASITKTYKQMNENQLNQVVQLIKSSQNILLAGDRFSQLVAQDFQMKLLSLGYYAKTYTDVNMQYQEIKQNSGLLILFSASLSRSKKMVEEAKKKHWKIVVVTRNKDTDVDIKICFDSCINNQWTKHSMNDRLCMQFIVDQITLKIAECARNRKQ